MKRYNLALNASNSGFMNNDAKKNSLYYLALLRTEYFFNNIIYIIYEKKIISIFIKI